MKLKPIHLLLILFLSLILCCSLGNKLIEGMASEIVTTDTSIPSKIDLPSMLDVPTSTSIPSEIALPSMLDVPTSTSMSTSMPSTTTLPSILNIPSATNTSTTSPATNASKANSTTSSINSATGAPSSTPINSAIIEPTDPNVANMPTYVNVNGITYFRPEYYPLNSYSGGISKDMIPENKENDYLLKTQIVPPVCPATQPIILYYNKENNSDNKMKEDYRFYNPYKYYSTMLPKQTTPQVQQQSINPQNNMTPVQQTNSISSSQNNINNVNRQLSEKNYNYAMYNRLYKPVETSEPLPVLNDFSSFS